MANAYIMTVHRRNDSDGVVIYIGGTFSSFERAVEAMNADAEMSIKLMAGSYNLDEKSVEVNDYLNPDVGIGNKEIMFMWNGMKKCSLVYNIDVVEMNEQIDVDKQTLIASFQM